MRGGGRERERCGLSVNVADGDICVSLSSLLMEARFVVRLRCFTTGMGRKEGMGGKEMMDEEGKRVGSSKGQQQQDACLGTDPDGG